MRAVAALFAVLALVCGEAGCGTGVSNTASTAAAKTSPTTSQTSSSPAASKKSPARSLPASLSPCSVLSPGEAEMIVPEASAHVQTSADGTVLPGECRYVAEVGTLNFEFYGGPPSYHQRPAAAQCTLAWERMSAAKQLFEKQPPPNETYELETVPNLGTRGMADLEKGTGNGATIVWLQDNVCAELTFSATASGASGAPDNSVLLNLAHRLSARL